MPREMSRCYGFGDVQLRAIFLCFCRWVFRCNDKSTFCFCKFYYLLTYVKFFSILYSFVLAQGVMLLLRYFDVSLG